MELWCRHVRECVCVVHRERGREGEWWEGEFWGRGSDSEEGREGVSVETREVEKLTSRASPPLSLLPSSTRGGLATLMTLSGEPAHCGPSPSDKCGLPRHSGAGERTRKEEGGCGGYYQGDSLVFSTIRTKKTHQWFPSQSQSTVNGREFPYILIQSLSLETILRLP